METNVTTYDEDFGKNLKAMRKIKGIGSRELSRMVGKAETYVSQIERGKIKYPDYQTAYKLMECVGYPGNIEDLLDIAFHIQDPAREKAYEEYMIERIEQEEKDNYEEYLEYKAQEAGMTVMDWLDTKSDELKEKTKKLHELLDKFIDKDYSRAERFINNIDSLTKDKENFNFFINLLGRYDYSKTDSKYKNQLLRVLYEFDENQTNPYRKKNRKTTKP